MNSALVTRTTVILEPVPGRVLAKLFVPGHELLADRESRATGVLARILALTDDDVTRLLHDVLSRFRGRHRDLPALLEASYQQIEHRVPLPLALTPARRTLIGAWFTHEFAIEGAALFNPSVVEHPDQSGLAPGQLRFVMSLRAVGEGHLSTIEMRTGVLGPGQEIHVDDPGPHVEQGTWSRGSLPRDLIETMLAERGADRESSTYLIRCLPEEVEVADLERGLALLAGQRVTRQGGARTAELARDICGRSYRVEFAEQSQLAERVLWPQAPVESHGLEDARFVRVADGYRATYTAFDGRDVVPQLLETQDFRTFHASPLAGPAARDKGMALFPRLVGGRHLALSRWDRESLAIASSDDGRTWDGARTFYGPTQPWELIQIGNCGSPIEMAEGWLVLTHGVGPMREYAIGALLLDLEDPAVVLGALRHPLLAPDADEREGYVPNVVYTCGPLLHDDALLVPYGASDARIRFALVDAPGLVAQLLSDGPPS